MKRIGSVVLCCVGVAALGAGTAVADNGNSTPNPNQVAAQQCTNELHTMGVKAFKALYAPNDPKHRHAMRDCQRNHGKQAGNVVNNAAQQCRAEQENPSTIPENSNPVLPFDEFYGTNINDRNAFGKCVSGKVQEAEDQNEENLQNAAQKCRAERSDSGFKAAHGGKTFSEFYGTEKSKLKNAFGKCVSKKAKEQNTTPSP